MKVSNVHHTVATVDRPLTRLQWLLFCGSLWALGIALSALIIVNLYFH
jgi:hypothetical protein